MDYNAILRDAASSLPQKEQAFSYFIKMYRADGLKYILPRCIFIPKSATEIEKAAVCEYFYRMIAALMYQKLLNGVLCPPSITPEIWFDILASSYLKEIDYNAILRSEKDIMILKKTAFWFFIDKYRIDGQHLILRKLKKYIAHLPEKKEEAIHLFSLSEAKLLEKIEKGELCLADKTCEAWFNQIAFGYIRNKIRAETALLSPNDSNKNDDDKNNDNDKNNTASSIRETEALLPKKSRIIDFDSLKIKVFKTDNKIEQEHFRDDLRYKLDMLIKEVSGTCQEYFAVFLTQDEDLFDWWKRTRSANQDLNDASVLKKVRSSFDATASNCKAKVRKLKEKYNIKFV